MILVGAPVRAEEGLIRGADRAAHGALGPNIAEGERRILGDVAACDRSGTEVNATAQKRALQSRQDVDVIDPSGARGVDGRDVGHVDALTRPAPRQEQRRAPADEDDVVGAKREPRRLDWQDFRRDEPDAYRGLPVVPGGQVDLLRAQEGRSGLVVRQRLVTPVSVEGERPDRLHPNPVLWTWTSTLPSAANASGSIRYEKSSCSSSANSRFATGRVSVNAPAPLEVTLQ